ncbi:MAG: carbohydrate kinase family protein [Thermotogae bacterium]|nr:carbohydrate kinase family protein [Thermotogota bacterium]
MVDFVCVGDVALDTYYKILEPLEYDKKVKFQRIGLHVGGMCFNTAYALAVLGSKTLFITTVGNDEPGSLIKRKLNDISLQTHLIVWDGVTTYETIVMLLDDGKKILFIPDISGLSNTEINIPPALLGSTKVLFTTLPLLIDKKISGSDVKIVVSLEKQVLDNQKDISSKLLNMNLDSIIFNYESFCTFFKIPPTVGNVLKSLSELSARNLIVTLGKKGAIAVSREASRPVECDAFEVNVVDTTGAGDIFAAGFLHTFYIDKLDLKSSLLFACGLASASCEQIGTCLNKKIVARAVQLIRRKEPQLVALLSDHCQ